MSTEVITKVLEKVYMAGQFYTEQINSYSYTDEELDAFLETYMSRIVHVHIKDVLYGPTPEGMPDSLYTLKGNYFWPVALGAGVMNHEKYVTALEKAGYKGIYRLEYGAPTDDSPCWSRL